MRAILAERAGGPEVLVPVSVDRPEPGAGEVLVRVHASGVNYADILCRTASHPGMPIPPLVPGCEGSGIVEAAGAGVTCYAPGDRVVVYSPPGGSYAEWMTAPVHRVLPVPPAMSLEEAAAFAHVGLTAYHTLSTMGRARPGEWLVVTAAAGGVGTVLVQLGRAMGLHVVAAAGSASKLEFLRHELGVPHVVGYDREPLHALVRELTGGRGADLVAESVGGQVFSDGLALLAPLGRLVLFGIASRDARPVRPFDLLPTSATFAALNMSVLFSRASQLVEASWQELLTLYERGAVRPVITERLRLDDASQAHRRMESRQTVGKLVLLIGS